jgi:hypothetical protein
VMGSLFVMAAVVVLSGFVMMACSVTVVLRCLPVVFCCLFRHVCASFLDSPDRNEGSPVGFLR